MLFFEQRDAPRRPIALNDRTCAARSRVSDFSWAICGGIRAIAEDSAWFLDGRIIENINGIQKISRSPGLKVFCPWAG
jgi:hypothetical protein